MIIIPFNDDIENIWNKKYNDPINHYLGIPLANDVELEKNTLNNLIDFKITIKNKYTLLIIENESLSPIRLSKGFNILFPGEHVIKFNFVKDCLYFSRA